MKISKKTYYGLRAILALSQANKSLSVHNLAETEQLPEDYLEKIFQKLRRTGIVTAHKGVSGGYTLARKTADMNVWEIFRTLDGPIKIVAPLKGRLPCLHVSHCQTNEVWRILEKEIEKILSKITIKQLINSRNPHISTKT